MDYFDRVNIKIFGTIWHCMKFHNYEVNLKKSLTTLHCFSFGLHGLIFRWRQLRINHK